MKGMSRPERTPDQRWPQEATFTEGDNGAPGHTDGRRAVPVPDPFDFEELETAPRREPREPVRVFAGFCDSCTGPIDANTGECRCSS